METIKKQKQYPKAKKQYVENKKATHKDFKVSLLSIETAEKIKELAKAEELSVRAFLEKTFK